MTKAEIIDLQQSLNRQGFDLVVDGRYGKKTHDAYISYLDRDPEVPTQVPLTPIPWWTSKTTLAILSTILVAIASLAGVELDGTQLSETLFAATTLVTGILALWANAKRKAPIDGGAILPGVRIDEAPCPLSADGQSNRPVGPFGY